MQIVIGAWAPLHPSALNRGRKNADHHVANAMRALSAGGREMTSRAAYCFRIVVAFAIVIVSGWARLADAEPGPLDQINIAIAKNADVVVVDASFTVPVSPRQAWEVLTDYVHMPEFLPQLRTSKVTQLNENTVRVFQDGLVFFGPIPISFEYLRDIELDPYREIRSHAIGGSLKRGDVSTTLEQQGRQTRITYHSEAVPDIWIPLGIGEAFIRSSIREQFVAMRREMIRRASARKNDGSVLPVQ